MLICDATLIKKAVLGMWTLDTVYEDNADANDDGVIDKLDVICILNAYYKHTTIDHIEVVTPPDKTEYVEGQSFDPTGMVIEAVYKDNTRETVTDYTYPIRHLELYYDTITIDYDGNTAEQDITVIKEA